MIAGGCRPKPPSEARGLDQSHRLRRLDGRVSTGWERSLYWPQVSTLPLIEYVTGSSPHVLFSACNLPSKRTSGCCPSSFMTSATVIKRAPRALAKEQTASSSWGVHPKREGLWATSWE